jgi:long-chain acyl-CoA synthetase
MNGAAILIVPKFSPAEVFKLIKKHQATIFSGVPTMYNYLYQYEGADETGFRSIRICILQVEQPCLSLS